MNGRTKSKRLNRMMCPSPAGKYKRLRRCESIRTPYRTMDCRGDALMRDKPKGNKNVENSKLRLSSQFIAIPGKDSKKKISETSAPQK